MERLNVKIKSKNQYYINVSIYIPQNFNNKKIIIACHGFDGSKESITIQELCKKLEEAGIGLVSFDFPYHGSSMANEEMLTTKNCQNDLKQVRNYIKRKYPECKIGIFSTSFGAYITLLELNNLRKNPYFAIICKSPAIKMDYILIHSLITEDLDILKKRGYTIREKKRKMKILYSFYEDLKENNLLKKYNKNYEILIFHGDIDDTAPIKDTILFSKKNKNIQLKILKNVSHKIREENLEKILNYSKNYYLKK